MMNRLIKLTLAATMLVLAGCPDDGEEPETDTVVNPDVSESGDIEEPDVPSQPDVVEPADDSVAPPEDAPGPEETAGDDVAEDIGGEDDTTTPDTEVDPGPTSTSLTFWFVGADDAIFGQDAEALTLYPENEPSEWADSPGLTMDIYAEADGVVTGAAIKLYIDSAENQQTLLVADEAYQGAMTFSNVVLPKSVEGYEVSVEVDGVDGAVVATKTVTVLTDGCQVNISPGAESCFVDADGGAFELAVSAQVSSGDCDQVSLSYRIGEEGEAMEMAPVSIDGDGNATFTLPLAAEGEVVEDNVYVDVLAIHPTSDALNGANATVYAVDNGVPTLSFTQPDGLVITTLNLQLDNDQQDANGLQFDVYGALEGLSDLDVGSVVLDINGTPLESAATPSSGGWSFPDVTFTEDGPVTFTVTGTDACGNVGTASVDVNVFATRPVLNILAPADGTTLLAKGDGDSATSEIYETTFNVGVQQLAAGTPVSVECKATGGSAEPTAILNLNAGDEGVDFAQLGVALNTAQFGQNLTCQVRATGQNPSVSNTVDLTIALPAPSFTISAPSPNAHLTSKVLEVAGEAQNLNGQPLEVEVYSDGSLVCTLSGGDISEGLIAATFDLDADCGGLADGTYFLKFDAVDLLGNRFSEIDEAPTFNVTFDTVAPQLAKLAPADELDPVAVAAHADVSAAAGYQTAFVFEIQNEFNVAGSEVCLTVSDVPQAIPTEAQAGDNGAGCQVVDLDGKATWPAVTLQPGANVYEAWAYDGFGNASQVYSGTINVKLEALSVAISAPDPSQGTVFVATEVIDVTVNVSDSDSGAPIDAATVALEINGELSDLVPSAEGGAYTFTNVPLTGGGAVDTLVGAASFAGLEGASATLQVVYKTSQPTIEIDALPALFNIASEQCAGSQANCLLSVGAMTTEVAEGGSATLDVACGDDLMSYDASVADAGALSFEGVTLIHGETCTLTATVTDAAQQSASSEVVSVSVDRVAPSFPQFKTPAEVSDAVGVLESLTEAGGDDKSLEPGMQHPLSVEVSGFEQGTEVTATLDWLDEESGEPQTRTLVATISEGVGDDALGSVNFLGTDGTELITWPNGDVTISVSASDAAGNPAAGLIATLLVQPDAPSVRIQVPLDPGASCTTSTDCSGGACYQGLCWTKWNIAESKQMLFSVSGLTTDTDNMRICSNAPALAATSSLCAANDGNGPYYQVGELISVSDAQPTVVFANDALTEGFQSFIAEIQPDPGGEWFSTLLQDNPVQAARRIYVDLSAPTLVDPAGDEEAINADSNDEAPATYLNFLEQEIGDGPQNPGGTFQFTVSASEDGTATVYVNGVEVQTVNIQSNVATFQMLLDEGPASIKVQLEDLAGNKSVAITDPSAEEALFVVDTIKPLITWTAPSKDTLIGTDSLDVEVACLEGCEGGGTVLLSHGTKGIIGQEELVSDAAIFADATYGALEEGGNELTATATDVAFNLSAVISKSTFVDSVPPSATFETLASYTLDSLPEGLDGQADDANPDTTPFDLALSFNVGDGATSWSLSLSACADADPASCGGASLVASGEVSGDTLVSQTVGVPILSASSHHLLTLAAQDAVGNTVSAVQGFRVDVSGCVVGLTNLPSGDYFNIANTCEDGLPCATATLVLNAEYIACGEVDVLRLFNGDTQISANSSPADGQGTLTIIVSDGDVLDLVVSADAGGVEQGASANQLRTVDFTAPAVSLVETTIGAFATPAEDASAVYGIAHDANPATAAEFEGHLAIEASDTNLAGGTVISVSATSGEGSVDLSPSNAASLSTAFGAATEQRNFLDLVYPDQTQSTITVTVADAAGNQASASFSATVDMIAPATPTLDAIDSAGVNTRLPSVPLSWTAVDEDAASGGAASTYDIRYSRLPITDEASFEAACQVSALAHTEAFPTPGEAGDSEAYTVAGPDPRADGVCKFVASTPSDGAETPTFYFALRAADAAGNWSEIATTSTDALVHNVTRIEVHSSHSANLTQNIASIGDVDGDTNGDIAFGRHGRGLCVVYGGDLGEVYAMADASSGSNHACVTDADLNVAGASELGSAVQALGDVNGDGLADFGASGRIDGVLGFIAVYLGQAGGPDLANPDVVIKGADPRVGTRYSSFCGAGTFAGQANGANPIHDIAVGEPGANVTGELSLVPGNASWTPGQGVTAPVVIDLEQAADNAAHNVMVFTMTFGEQYAFDCHAAGDVLPTPGDAASSHGDLMVYQNWGGENRVFVHPGRAIPAGGASVTLSGGPDDGAGGCPDGTDCSEDDITVRLFQDAGLGSDASFGYLLSGGVDLSGDDTADLVLGQPYRSSAQGGDGRAIWIFDGSKLADAAGPAGHKVVSYDDQTGDSTSWQGVNGWVFDADFITQGGVMAVVGDFDGWTPDGKATPDIVITSNSWSFAALYLNHRDDVQGFAHGSFPHRDLAMEKPTAPGDYTMLFPRGGDHNGDGKVDIIVSSLIGEITIIH